MKYSKKIDTIKAFAILTVVYGHSMQFGSGADVLNTGSFFEDGIFKFIYSFHMPLFMLISGYLFRFSLKKNTFLMMVQSRISTLLLPIFSWSLLSFGIDAVNNPNLSFIKMIKGYLHTAIHSFWFLWAIFYCSMVVLVINRYLKDRMIVYIAGFFVTFFLPDTYNLSLYKFMYPFFLLGYFYSEYSGKSSWIHDKLVKGKKLIILICLVYACMFRYYNYHSYIYTTGYTLLEREWLHQFGTDMYRFMIGFVGSIMVILILSTLYQKLSDRWIDHIALVGANSMGIYIISGFCFIHLLPQLTTTLTSIDYFINFMETIIIILGSLGITILIKKSRMLNRLLLGGRL